MYLVIQLLMALGLDADTAGTVVTTITGSCISAAVWVAMTGITAYILKDRLGIFRTVPDTAQFLFTLVGCVFWGVLVGAVVTIVTTATTGNVYCAFAAAAVAPVAFALVTTLCVGAMVGVVFGCIKIAELITPRNEKSQHLDNS